MTDSRVQHAEPQESAPAAPSRGRRSPWWAGALALVLAVAIGVGIGFLAASRDSATSSPVDPQVEQLLDDFFAGWNAYDADAIRAVATDDAVVGNGRPVTATGALSLETKVEEYRNDGVSWERVGDPIVRDAGAHLDVVQLGRGGSSASGDDDFVLVFRLVREDGALKVEWERPYDYQAWRSLGL